MNILDSKIHAAAKGWSRIPSYRSAFAYVQLPLCDAVVLDIGCSKGDHATLWKRDGNQVIGIDTDETAINIARETHPESDFRLLLDSSIPLQDNSIDVVIMLDAIEHVENEKFTLMEIWRVLKPEGQLILTTPYRNILGDWMDGDNLFFIPLYRFKNWILKRPITFSRHRHYRTADLLTMCPGKFQVTTEEITGGGDTAFLTFSTKFIGKMMKLLPPKIHDKYLPTASKLQARLKVKSQDSHFNRRKLSLACKLNLVLRKRLDETEPNL